VLFPGENLEVCAYSACSGLSARWALKQVQDERI
jgi:hypothetical protein